MKTIYYEYKKTFDQPGPNQPEGAITTYFKMRQTEKQQLHNFIIGLIEKFKIGSGQLSKEDEALFHRPHHDFKKRGRGKFYTPMEIIMMPIKQLDAGKDLTKSMVDRWNRLFDELPECQILMKKGMRLR